MDCNQTKDHLYEWVTGKLEGDPLTSFEKHLQECQGCRQAAERMSHTIKALNTVEPPPLSARFTEKVLQEARSIPLPEKTVWERFKEWFQVPYIKWPMEALATAAVILIAVTVYKDVSLTKPSIIEMTPRSFQVEITGTSVQHPIIIPTADPNKALSNLVGLVKQYNGQLVQTLVRDKEIQVVLSLKKENEAAFLTRLNRLGSIQKGQDGFRDDKGNMVVVLKLR
jgi:hypothetical protein